MLKFTHKTFGHIKLWPRSCATTPPPSASAAQQQRKTVGLTQPPDPQSVSCDYIGPPDAQSNLRPYVRHYDEHETPLAKLLRMRRIEVEEWNKDFWIKHNKRFYEEKNEFIKLHNLAGNEEVSADSMSIFYKSFLDKNRRMHWMYNISWYLKNFDILTLAAQVSVQKMLRRRRGSSAQRQ